ncbi:MAG: PAS domain-containing protein, partial [Waterburya sp.]
MLGLSISAIKVAAEENILVIHSYDSELSSTKQQQLAIEQGFAEIGSQSNVFHEFIDSKRHPPAEYGEEFLDYINKKYKRIPIDLLMVVEEPSLELMLRQHQEFFPDIPVVFLGIEHLSQEMLDTPWLTGVMESYSILETVLEATRQTWTDTVIIINQTTEAGKAKLEQIEAVKSISRKPLEVKIVNDLTPKEITVRLGKYPGNVPVLVLGQLLQNGSKKTSIDPKLDTQILQQYISNPIYTDQAIRIGTGVVGGKVFDVDYHARQAVELAEKILQGAKPDEVGPVMTGKNRWIFDYRQLLKHNIKLDLLPEDSELLFMEPPPYVKYRTLIVLAGLMLLSSFLAIILLIEKGRKRELTNKILQENEQRYKDLAKAGANVFWELDRDLRYSYISGDLKDLCGLTSSEMKGHYPADLHQNDSRLDVDWELFKSITQTRKPFKNFTFSLQDKNDGIRIFKI